MLALDLIPTLSLRWMLPFVASFGLLAVAGPAEAATESKPPSPKPWLQDKVEQARELSVRKIKPGSPEAQKLKDEFKALVDDTLDWDLMTERSLGRSWKDLRPKQRSAFSALLRKLIESSYQSKMRLAAKKDVDRPEKVSIEWGKPKIRKKNASIEAKVKADKAKTFLGFKLTWDGQRWRVYDVAIDDVSTVRTYRSQFRKLIEDKGFDELMRRMQAKLSDIEAGRADIGQ